MIKLVGFITLEFILKVMAENLQVLKSVLEDYFGEVYLHEELDETMCDIAVVGVVENKPSSAVESNKFLFTVQGSKILIISPELERSSYNLKYSTCHRCMNKDHCSCMPSLDSNVLSRITGEIESEDTLCSECYKTLLEKSEPAFEDIDSSDSLSNLI